MRIFLACMVFMIVPAASAQTPKRVEQKETKAEKKAEYKGTWTKEGDGIDIQVKFVKDKAVEVVVMAGDNGIKILSDYTVNKSGLITAKANKIEEIGSFPQVPPKGFTFKFKFKIADGTATMSDFEAADAEGAKDIMEGEYKAKKDK